MSRLARMYSSLANHEFRLLTLEPGQNGDWISCSLTVHSLEETPAPQFETVSYCWGNSGTPRWININGSRCPVPPSSEQVLRRMRLPNLVRVLWIDAICINQNDLGERACQVAMMGQIYSYGLRNLIHLGSLQDDNAGIPVQALRAAYHKLEQAVDALTIYERQQWEEWRNEPESWNDDPLFEEADIAPLEPLFRLPWFTRLWVIQEVCLAQENLCHWGTTDFPLFWITELAQFNVSTPDWWCEASETGYSTVFWLQETFDTKKYPRSTALNNLFELSHRMCTKEPHDRIFAIRQLLLNAAATEGDSDLLVVDYSKQIEAVLRDATIFILAHSGSDAILDDLFHETEAEMHTTGIPTWSAPWLFENDKHGPYGSRGKYAGSPSVGKLLPFKIQRNKEPAMISTNGFLVGEVTRSTPSFDFLNDFKAVARAMDAALDQIIPTAPRNLSSYETAVLVLTGGWLPKRFENLTHAAQCLQDLYRRGTVSERRVQDNISSQLQNELDIHISKHSSWCCFFSLGSKFVGSGPRIMRKGDQVVIPIGAHLPYILRPTRADADDFYFVGTALIPGLLDGEVFDLGLEERRFKLR
ncbi:Heterokaryon incompatibility protein 6, OR allele [Pseudocercospora fuligena]|uniref:Heterokaryon incompatibility protein 6, OR allele n=1 Tax=Pseudocercospora fuligena TaxID=685502 RepID=A0A8H6VH73_9PEZI|nr:Heterokaryon incompatibility protein 6, OR allele [Pseudocercospora fuligena]